MKNNVKSFYELIQFGLGGATFQQFVDKFQDKYNDLNTEGYVWDNEIQLDYTYEQLIASLNIKTLPVYVDVDSEGLDKSFGEFNIGSNKIPTQKHRYAMNQKILRERMIMIQRFGASALNGDTQNAIMDLLFDSTDNLLGGNRNALTHQRMRINSTGQFEITLENNPRGIKGLKFDFGIPETNKATLTTTARWWTSNEHTVANEGSNADPLGYMKQKVKEARRKGFPRVHWEMSETLFDDMLTHSKVLSKVGYSIMPNAASEDAAKVVAQNMNDEALKNAIEKIVGCPIKTYDSIAAVDKFDAESKSLKPTTIDNFAVNNISLIPDGQIGTIKAVQPLLLDDLTTRAAWFDGGRTLITQRFDSATKTMYVESEMATLCVPNMPQYMCIYTVTA